MENNENLEHPQAGDYQQDGTAENELNNYTSGPLEDDDAEETSDLDDTEENEDAEDIAGDLAGNASGNEDAEDE